jgi:hypothetical protein
VKVRPVLELDFVNGSPEALVPSERRLTGRTTFMP